MNRLLLVGALVAFVLAAVSAFTDSVNVNETGWIAVGLAAWVGSQVAGIDLGFRGPRRRVGRRR